MPCFLRRVVRGFPFTIGVYPGLVEGLVGKAARDIERKVFCFGVAFLCVLFLSFNEQSRISAILAYFYE